ncbi:uncharacterized protein si:ch211-161h7.5 [Hypomesus transpacificus]|uniref:uncharacterized protein si:ch211-161h7.5 n=1 Tax=Hypomesus transpacificus TaxID=137520 RepID=UPI001F07ABA3|nr:uncharacterized protein si:ch211-161h7.5 [Hypomesus transpacificus]
MEKHNPGRLALIVASLVSYIIIIVFNILAGPGLDPFKSSTANVSAEFDTQITPSGGTFSIWGVIYAWLTLMLGYILSGLCRKNAYGWVYCSPPVLPYGFFVSWILNMGLNIGWLLLWDRTYMIPALVFLFLVACTNYVAIFFTCHGLHIYGAWLNKYHKVDLWLIRALVQNALSTYTTWTSIATLINLTIVMNYDGSLSATDAATVSLSILTVVLVVWFVLENFVLDKHMRYILTIYPVVIVALAGNLTKNYDASSPSRNAVFEAVLMGLTCFLFVVRIGLVVWRHIKNPLYKHVRPDEAVSPMEIAEKTRKIFL